MDAVCSYVHHSNPTYTLSLNLSSSSFSSSALSSPPSLSLLFCLSLSLKHILLLAAALSYKHASTHPWKKKYDVGRGEGGEMHELSFNKGER